MSNATSNALSSSPLSSSGRRSLFSRLTSPLRPRNRALTDFEIRPAEPHRVYSPGDIVKGAVVLKVTKPIRITHLTVCLHGFVRVFKHPNGASETPPVDAGLTTGSNPRKTQYFGNGHASLFQDEITLCGEGRLEAGIYEFNFELEFPQKGLPTSIDFERGTIAYMITSTLTRPTSIAATSTCDQKVALVETVDIGPMLPPKPRTISLEPISRRSRRTKTVKNKESSLQDTTETNSSGEAARKNGSPLPDESASQCGSLDHLPNTRSPAPIDVQSSVSAANSADSTASSMSFRIAGANGSTRSTRDSANTGSKVSLADKTITATIELLKAGSLPGESLPLKISIKHTKAIKSMHGIIITLYRQGRIDSAPPLSLFVDIKGKEAERLKHEEYYPKSKTGLSGLSLTSAGSSSLFRKDLAQTFAPILVDPTTLTSVVNASVRVPEDAFPTISGVPGQMISFKYHVEVVVDLGGKLAGQERHLPRVGTLSLPSSFANSGGRADGNPNLLAAWGGSIVDTDHIRREKSVVVSLFEIAVGTTDSARKRGRGNSVATRTTNDAYDQQPTTPLPTHEPIYEESLAPSNGHGPPLDAYHDEQYHEYYPHDPYDYNDAYNNYYPPPAHAEIHVPPPEVQPEEDLSEKERVRRAEERLLPSQPPIENGEPSSSRTLVAPSVPPAPSKPSEDDLYSPDDTTPRITPSITRSFSHDSAATPIAMPSAPPLEEISPNLTLPSAPTLEHINSHTEPQTDDKQELERRRMLAEASAPSEFPSDDDDNAGEGSSRAPNLHEPSAPILVDDDYGGQYSHHSILAGPSHSESLPKYER